MKVAQKQADNNSKCSSTENKQSSWQNPLAQVSNDSKQAVAQRALIDGINDSPRMLAQRRQIEGYVGSDQQHTTVQACLNLPSVQPIQAKLTIGQLADKYEQEADRVATEVVEKINAPASAKSTQEQMVQREAMPKEVLRTRPILQHREVIGGGEASTHFESAINNAKGGGQTLDAGLQQLMGQTMGADFSGVKVHTDVRADQLNQSIQAKAFTTGQDVFFRRGVYQPGSRGGQELIAHELTHVVQQKKDSGAVKVDSQPISHISNNSSKNQESNFIQRKLDEDFEHGGTPKPGEEERCKSFALKVSDYVDLSYDELISGKVSEWKGAKFGTFLNLVSRDSRVAHTHAANAIEERVYGLMSNPLKGLNWTPQFTEGMGVASKPDIVIHVSTEEENKKGEIREALVDITSDRAHILRKAGNWTTNPRYIYVAEAYFPSVLKTDIPGIKQSLKEGGVDLKTAKRLKKEADAIRAKKKIEKAKKEKKVREKYNEFNNFSDYAKNYEEFADLPEGKRVTAAASFLRRNGIKVKGMPEKKGPRKMNEYTKQLKIKRAKKAREAREKKDEKTLLMEIQGKQEESESEDTNEEEMFENDDE